MYLLVVRDPEGNETEYDLVGEAILGRDESADVTMPSPGVSRRHARVFLEDGLCYVEDLGSANGTLIEGEPVIGQVALEPGRSVALGPFQVWVEEPEVAGPPVTHRPSSVSLAKVTGVAGRWSGHGAGLAGSQLLGTLEGISGAALGLVFEVRQGATIGRLPENGVPVDDPSMSRKHAQVSVVNGQVTLRDLESANGTFVNDEPIAEQVLVDGDIVTFGSVAFRFAAVEGVESGTHTNLPAASGSRSLPTTTRTGPRGKPPGRGMPARRKALVAVAASIVVLFVVLAVVMRQNELPPQGSTPSTGQPAASDGEGENLRQEVFNLMRRGQLLMDSDSWVQAEEVLARVVELDPINAEARDRLAQVRLEMRMQTLFEEGNRLAQIGSLEEAVEKYMQIEAESSYRRRARFQVQQLVERLMVRHDGECRGLIRIDRFREALIPCRRYMDFACQCPETVDSRVEAALARAERGARVASSERWRCPTGFSDWLPCASRALTPEHDPERTIDNHFPNSEVASAMKSYFRGQIEESLRELGRIEDRRGVDSSVQEQARSLRRQIRYANGKFQQGQTQLLRGEIEQAHREWNDLFETDIQLMPHPLQSSLRREALRRLSAAYHDRGFELHRMRRYPEAFDWYRKGYEVNPDDTRIGEGIRRLEGLALQNLRRAQTCGDLRQILRYTMDNPPSAAHNQVKQAIQNRGC